MFKTSTNDINPNAFKGTQEMTNNSKYMKFLKHYEYLDHQLSAFSALLAATVVQSDHRDEGDY